ncbi:protein kinase domain-containing protein [Streptomyces longispororuber]|uniref:serine/threonine-protein kinase n=1 Tax=Streptomyces longispororuber TaxID=68230 RepID=UPI00210A5AD2|nr:serine/threonine-protein kinase [Streptomyces longispororuber]MCQ4213215.1 PQQ-binding-like beta-propeller repeat protein [Streptomyces longispororuber]
MTPLSPEDPPAIGDYTLADRIGTGGMGVVYAAASSTGRRVALKVVHQQFADDEEFRGRFRQEVAAARRVSGVFTAAVVDADPEAPRPWMATAYIEGPTLADRVRDQGALHGRELRDLAVGLAEALRDIHRAGLVHRDLKPANIVLSPDGPRVIDFGISRAADNQALTMTGRVMGTPPFMSPEQLQDPRGAGPASDVFSLAAVLVYAATGHGPFDADSPYMTAYQVVHEQPELTGVPVTLRAAVEPCLAKDPADRPPLGVLLTALRRLPTAADAPGRVPHREPATRVDTTATPARRPRRLFRLLGAAVGLAVVAGGCVVMLRSPDDPGSAAVGSEKAVKSAVLPAGWHSWQTRLDSGRLAPRCVSDDGGLYCTDADDAVARIDGATGRVGWRTGTPADRGAPPLGVTDRLVVTHEKRPDGSYEVVGRSRTDGQVRWHRTVSGQWRYTAMAGGTVYAVLPGERQVAAVRASDGAALWKGQVPAGWNCDLYAYDGPLFGFCEDDGVTDTSAAPSRLLTFRAKDGAPHWLASTLYELEPLGEADGDLVALGFDGGNLDEEDMGSYTTLVRIDTTSGSLRTTPITGIDLTVLADPHLRDGVVYFTRITGETDAVDARSGKHLWSHPRGDRGLGVTAEPVVSTRRDEVYFLSDKDRLTAVDRRSGKVKWRGPERSSRVTPEGPLGFLALVDDAVVSGSKGRLTAVSPDAPDAKPRTGTP